MSDKPPKLNVPKDPVVIGKTRNGEPIWLEPKDLIPTPDEDLERWDKTLDGRQRALIERAAKIVLVNATVFLEETILKTASKSFVEHYRKATDQEMTESIIKAGYRVIQDGLKTVVLLKGTILREMTAEVELRWQPHVARKVNEMVKKKQCPI